jgi:hypothetical protein
MNLQASKYASPPGTPPLLPPSTPAIGQSTDPEAELLLRLYNLDLPAVDISHVIAAMTGRNERTVEDTRLLQRLYDLGVPTEDISFIVEFTRRRGRSRVVAQYNTVGWLAYDFPER